jgi:hypothetical protein
VDRLHRRAEPTRPTRARAATSAEDPDLLRLQRLIGNAGVTSVVQREDEDEYDDASEVDSVDTGPDEVPGDDSDTGDGGAGATDAALADTAAADAGEASGDDTGPTTDDLDRAFDPDVVVSTMGNQGLGASDLAPSEPSDTMQALRIQRDPPSKEPEPTKQGGAGDLLSALSELPQVKAALERLKDLVKQSWEEFKKGTTTPEKVVVFTVAGLVVGGAGAGALGNKDARGLVFKGLDGTKIPIPGVDGLSVTPKFDDKGFKGGTVNLDVLKLFPQLRKVPGLD